MPTPIYFATRGPRAGSGKALLVNDNPKLKAMGLRVAVVVPDSRLAYRGWMVFSDENHRNIYNNMEEAILWLRGEEDLRPVLHIA